MVIAIDFDNTISTHNYPYTGYLIPMAKEVIDVIKDNGHHTFLWTVRSDESFDSEGRVNSLNEAKKFIIDHEIEIDTFNVSPIHPSSSPKQLAHIVIDDINLGTPMMFYKGHRVVNWYELTYHLENRGVISFEEGRDLRVYAETYYPNEFGTKN